MALQSKVVRSKTIQVLYILTCIEAKYTYGIKQPVRIERHPTIFQHQQCLQDSKPKHEPVVITTINTITLKFATTVTFL